VIFDKEHPNLVGADCIRLTDRLRLLIVGVASPLENRDCHRVEGRIAFALTDFKYIHQYKSPNIIIQQNINLIND
jgi:chloramphenicol 3-O-phosphotransferase